MTGQRIEGVQTILCGPGPGGAGNQVRASKRFPKMNKSSESIEEKVEEMVSIVDKLGSLLRGILGAKKEDIPSGVVEIVEEKSESMKEDTPSKVAEIFEEKSESMKESLSEDETHEPIMKVAVEPKSVSSNGQAKVKKSDIVREFFEKHGTEIRNKDVVEIIKKEKGVELTESLVSILKKKISENQSKSVARKDKEPKVWTSRVTSGSALIREYLEENGIETSNEEVVNHLKKKGVKVKPTLVSSVRAILKKKGIKTSKMRRKVKTVRGPTMPSAVVEALKKAGKGMELSEVAQKVVKSGYVYKGNKGIHGITQNVFQALHSLCKKTAHPGFKGTTPVVIHEKVPGQRFGRYRLNPKAVKNKVA
jgi:hypothetical protein